MRSTHPIGKLGYLCELIASLLTLQLGISPLSRQISFKTSCGCPHETSLSFGIGRSTQRYLNGIHEDSGICSLDILDKVAYTIRKGCITQSMPIRQSINRIDLDRSHHMTSGRGVLADCAGVKSAVSGTCCAGIAPAKYVLVSRTVASQPRMMAILQQRGPMYEYSFNART